MNDERRWRRVPQIDLLRGVAVLMMVVFHLQWSLDYFGVDAPAPFGGFWNLFQKATGGLFISLVGVSLVLSHSPSASAGKYLSRGGRIFGYGLLVTLGSLVFKPEGFVFFGVLHFIGLAIVLAFPFIRFTWLNLLLGIMLLGAGIQLQSMSFDFPWLVWLGFRHPVYTIDIYPLLPWIGVVFLGMFAGRIMVRGGRPDMTGAGRRRSRPLRYLGRHALPAYFIHLPLVFVAAFAISEALPRGERTLAPSASVERAGSGPRPSRSRSRDPARTERENMKPEGIKPEAMIRRWSGILRLQDWDIRHTVVQQDWRKRGDIKIDTSNRMAVLMVHHEVDDSFIEELVVHELLHLKLYDMDQMIEELINLVYGTDEEDPRREFAWSRFMEALESTTEDLTKALLAASGSPGELNFDRVMKQVEEELEGRA